MTTWKPVLATYNEPESKFLVATLKQKGWESSYNTTKDEHAVWVREKEHYWMKLMNALDDILSELERQGHLKKEVEIDLQDEGVKRIKLDSKGKERLRDEIPDKLMV